ncbi:ABC transporter ATP-binding protein [Jiangella mangrovi]|uniref:NitT/TauT family transport system ATP-binding protein n=1 Tax=Jiangella mangrovi TaxID=1524084 RepID=A0A7W9GS97_9ACTN|nr:ABC transporter ATP-binding protein [Jiangella mangrovi]MBB5788992.1 NitT/TauT family transport system ATP-binding protein [Jiangella mangrovi]
MTTTPMVSIRDFRLVRQTRNGSLLVLDDVSFDVADREFVAIVGPSGCGKTTLLKSIDGLIPRTSGEITVNGTVVDKPGPDRGFVFQMDSLFPWRTVLANIRLGLEARAGDRATKNRIARDLAALVGLQGFEEHYPHQLSGGMRQRVNVARALAVDPQVLLMDEPFSSLDAQTREVLQEELLRIWSERSKTVIFVTHQIDEAAYLADRVIVLSARPGRVRASIPIELPRPRTLELKRTPEFIAIVDRIWQEIELNDSGRSARDADDTQEARVNHA